MGDLMTMATGTLINLHARLWREFDAHNDPRVFWRLVAIEVHANLMGMDMAVFARRRGHPRPYVHSATRHKASHSVAAMVGVVAFVVILLVGAAALTHSGGGKPDTRRVIHPHLSLIGGAGVAPAASVAYLVRYVNDQKS